MPREPSKPIGRKPEPPPAPPKKYNALEVLGKVSGLGTDEAKRIFEQVKENQRRLDECVGPHDFQPIGEEKKFGRRHVCTLCKGEIDSINKSWYETGLKHGAEQAERKKR